MVRSPAARAHPSLYAQPAAGRDCAGHGRRLHAVFCSHGSTSIPVMRSSGADGLRAVLVQLDGIEVPAKGVGEARASRARRSANRRIWTRCASRARSPGRASRAARRRVVGATPIALMMREHAAVFRALRDKPASPEQALSDSARQVLSHLGSRGASFAQEIAGATGLSNDDLKAVLGELVAAGLVSSDGFAGLRGIIESSSSPRTGRSRPPSSAGRWFVLGAESLDFARDNAEPSGRRGNGRLDAAPPLRRRLPSSRDPRNHRRHLARAGSRVPPARRSRRDPRRALRRWNAWRAVRAAGRGRSAA